MPRPNRPPRRDQPRGPRPARRPAGPVARQAADEGGERLQKVLAAAGLGSRRACEELITSGRVEVDRTVVTELGTRVDPETQEIRVDGERLPRVRRVVFLLNKPVGVVTTNYDPSGRPRAVDLVPADQRLFAIGRLDRMSEGLLLLTNDGGLANLLAHPRYGVEKKYLVQVAGVPSEALVEKLRQGVRLAEGEVHAKRVSVRSQHKQSAVLEMVLDEGKNREIRRMLAQLGHKVHQLKRVAVGTLSIGNLLPGQWRQLAWSEVEELRRDALAAVGPDGAKPPRGRPGPPGRPARPGRFGRPAGGPRGDRPPRRPAGAPRQPGGGGGQPGGGRGQEGGGRGQPGGAGRAGGRRRRPGKASAWRGKPQNKPHNKPQNTSRHTSQKTSQKTSRHKPYREGRSP
ncbi:MAG: pseudouridine synthase [Planctomycetaceae bacterium]